jgi:hypothetical protein
MGLCEKLYDEIIKLKSMSGKQDHALGYRSSLTLIRWKHLIKLRLKVVGFGQEIPFLLNWNRLQTPKSI